MKRRNKSWLIAALVALSAVMVLTGCSLSQVLSLTIVDYPATTYEVGSNPDIEFTVEAEMDNGDTKTLTYNEYSSVLKLSGFSTAEVGTFTATVTYRNVSATFDYEVVEKDSVFAGGVGTESNPYIINTTEQFLKISDSDYEGSYFRLGADIDLAGVEATAYNRYFGANAAIVGPFKGVLDGNGHKIINCASGSALFSEFSGATIKNCDVYTNGTVNLVIDIYGEATINNVNRYGEMVLQGDTNIGAFITYVINGSSLIMEKCNNYVNIRGTAMYSAGFIGIPMMDSQYGTKIVLNECVNYGDITGQRAGAFFANNYAVVTEGIVMTDCSNEGSIIGVEQAGFYFATGEKGADGKYSAAVGTISDNRKTENLTDNKVSLKATLEGLKATVGTDGKITVESTNADIAHVVVRGYFYANVWSNYGTNDAKNEGTLIQLKDELLTFNNGKAEAIEVAKIQIARVNGENATIGNNVDTWDPSAGTYLFGYQDEYYTYTLDDGKETDSHTRTLTIFVLAFNAEGELIGGCVPTASN